MRSSRIDFNYLMARRNVAVSLRSSEQRVDAYQLEKALSLDLLNYILQETAEFPSYRLHMLDLFHRYHYQVDLLHIQGQHDAEHKLFDYYHRSLMSIASYIHVVKNLAMLPPVAFVIQSNIFADGKNTTPRIEEVTEERPSPPPGFGPND